MKEVKITLLQQDDRKKYELFLEKNDRNLIYSTLEFGDFLKETAGGEAMYYLARRGDDICGALPLFSLEHPVYGRVVNSLPWYGSYGGCTVAEHDDRRVRTELLHEYVRQLNDADLFSATLILSPFENGYLEDYREVLNSRVLDKRIGQITRLPAPSEKTLDDLMMTIKQKTRNLVRKSMQQGFHLEVTDEDRAWRFLHETHTENLAAIGGKAKPWEHFEAIRRNIPAAWRRLYLASKQETPVAALLVLLFNKTAEYITPVVKAEYRSSQALSFVIFNAMLDAARAGFTYWNWGGTWITQQSLHHFKAGWGADDHNYTYLINIPEKAVGILRNDREAVLRAFPYYYVFPLDQLQ